MKIHSRSVIVHQTINIELDANKFTDEFRKEFRENFYPFYTVNDHAEHIAQLQARGVIDLEAGPCFIEGYGPSEEMGITATVIDQTQEVL